ncbi:ribosomal protein L1 [Amniculicola lignicola CBS 123094]|uniref:Ribosomal protein L1 n=1 Tax=Amniculicola lignicola CBS 123094 TaxID=1392246 RepID=A0A6A5WB78_9PLEO|nr:ribosomal protein L1 [Amniculicola lignicola CBS 123094]
MAHARSFIPPFTRLATCSIAIPKRELPRFAVLPLQSIRCASTKTPPPKKKKKTRNTFIQYDLKEMQQFSLVDAMQYIRAFEVGRDPSSAKYEMHVRLRTLKNGPVVRNRLRLPHAVNTDIRICVICPPDSAIAAEARSAGATLVGEDEIFAQVKEGIVNFDRCICHADSLAKMNKAGLGRILGPRGLLPSTKTGTVVTNVGKTVKNMAGGSEYRERMGVVRMAVGQLGFTPDQLRENVKAFLDEIKKDMGQMSDRISKEIHEVVLSSTQSPGFSLSGEFKAPNSIATKELGTPL